MTEDDTTSLDSEGGRAEREPRLLGRVLAELDEADSDEAAAIAAALCTHLRREGTGARADDRADEWAGDRGGADVDEPWAGRGWWFAGRIEVTQRRSVRVPETAPDDPWTAAGRADRFPP